MDGRLFLHTSRTFHSYFSTEWYPYQRQYFVRSFPYHFRHTTATRLNAESCKPTETSSTQIYSIDRKAAQYRKKSCTENAYNLHTKSAVLLLLNYFERRRACGVHSVRWASRNTVRSFSLIRSSSFWSLYSFALFSFYVEDWNEYFALWYDASRLDSFSSIRR
jgi:hypothetical protein